MVRHLPSAVKHLLTLRNPNVLPGPPAGKLNAILSSTFRDAKVKKAETGWLVLTVSKAQIAEKKVALSLRKHLTDLYTIDCQPSFDYRAPVQLRNPTCCGKQQHPTGN